MSDAIGYLKGERCNRNGCNGIIDEHPSESSCSCHINPPCSYCTDAREYCPICEWEGREEQLEKQYKKPVKNDAQSVYNRMAAREDTYRHKIDRMRKGELPIDGVHWYHLNHTHFTMKKVGVFPKGMTRQQLERELIGSFGGRFEGLDMERGTFTYIAYTD